MVAAWVDGERSIGAVDQRGLAACPAPKQPLAAGQRKRASRYQAQANSARTRSGSGTDFCALKSVHTTVAPPLAWISPGWSLRSSVA